MTRLFVLIIALAACAPAVQVAPVRFKNAAPIWKVNDRVHLAKKPEERKFSHLLYFFDAFFFNQLTEAMDLKEPRRALDINSIDEVPNSTWFTNRIGVREMTADEISRGPYGDAQLKLPIQIKGTKVGGKSIGLIVKDANGDKYITKFDELGFPSIETAANVIVLRLMWALGYNVPNDAIVYLTRDDLKLAKDAEVKDVFGNKRPMTERDLEDRLSKINLGTDKRYRTNASKFLTGVPIGGFSQIGTRDDDPNDRIAHEHRRVVRALYVFYSWMQATDVKEDNSLDIYATDPADKNTKYVVHYVIDFGKSLGANGSIPLYIPDGHAARFDLVHTGQGLITFGFRRRPWEGTYEPTIEGLGRIDVEHFNPEGYNPQQPYRPFEFVDRFDGFWAAKLIMRFNRDQIRAAVENGKFEDVRAVDYLTEVLVGRQQKLGRHWFSKVSPLDGFTIDETKKVCFSDLMIRYNLDPVRTAKTQWAVEAFDYAGRSLDWSQVAQPTGQTSAGCVSGFPVGAIESGYTILRFTVRRHDRALPPVDVHLARESGTGPLRIIGLYRN